MQKFRARPAPAISHGYSRSLTLPENQFRHGNLPAGLRLSDLNFSDPGSSLHRQDIHLISAGQFRDSNPDHHPVPPTNKDVKVISDWGGFQIIDNPGWYEGQTTVVQSFMWQEHHSDIAVGPDIPSRAATRPNARFNTTAACLAASEQNKKWALNVRSRNDLIMLDVIQGGDHSEAEHWRRIVRQVPLEGVAFGGQTGRDLYILTRLLVKMRDAGDLHQCQWMHFLGIGMIEAGLAYSIIGRSIIETLGHEIPISFDFSTPFTESFVRQNVAGFPKLSPKGLIVPYCRGPHSPKLAGSAEPFPLPVSTIGKRLSVGDLCVKGDRYAKHAWDQLSHMMAANHNLDVMALALDQAHLLFDAGGDIAAAHIPPWLLEFGEILPEILASQNAMQLISKYRHQLKKLA